MMIMLLVSIDDMFFNSMVGVDTAWRLAEHFERFQRLKHNISSFLIIRLVAACSILEGLNL